MPNPSTGLMPDDQWDYDEDIEDDEVDDFDCGLGSDGQCCKAGSEECDFECPNRNSELFAGSAAWMRAHGSSCRKCGDELADGQEPDHPRLCSKCDPVNGVPAVPPTNY